MSAHTGIFLGYSRGLHTQDMKKGIIKVTSLKPEESAKAIGWTVGWPASEPKIFGKIIGQHGKSGFLMAQFKHGFPGDAIGQPITVTQGKPTRPAPKTQAKKSRRSPSVMDIEGIGKEYAEKLNENKIQTIDDLLEAGATPDGRKQLSEMTGISSKLVLEWVNLADLFRIKGVGEEYADLLEEAGVDTVVELATRKPENLHKKMGEVNEAKKIVRKLPSLSMVEGWVKEAKTLPRKVEY